MDETKGKRGRPPFESNEVNEVLLGFVELHFREIYTKRGKQNKVYTINGQAAVQKLGGDIEKFFVNDSKHVYRQSILAEIGRLKDEELMQEMARLVYQYYLDNGDMTTKEWCKIIRMTRKEWLK